MRNELSPRRDRPGQAEAPSTAAPAALLPHYRCCCLSATHSSRPNQRPPTHPPTHLQTLPEGPYLASLECLDLAHNSFSAGYPPAPAAASRLKQLSFQHRGVHYSDPSAALRHSVAELAQLAGAAAAPAVTAAVLPPQLAAAVAAQE